MKDYPSIDGVRIDTPIYAFDKLDGSNVRAEWTRKSGFCKYGSRTRLLDASDLQLGESIALMQTYEEAVTKILRDARIDKATLFFEYFGANSFAGVHVNEEHRVVLIDANLHPKGFADPRDFRRLFEDKVATAAMVYHGNPNADFVESVRNGTLEGMTFEGVVCKVPRSKPSHPHTMFKVKSLAWISRVKALYTDPAKLAELL